MYNADRKTMKVLNALSLQETTVYIFIIIILHYLAYNLPYFKMVIFS